MVVDLNGRQIDLEQAFPLLNKDWKKLEKMGWSLERMQAMSMTDGLLLAFYLLRKVDPTVTQAELDELPFKHPAIQKSFEVFKAAMDGDEVDRPLSG